MVNRNDTIGGIWAKDAPDVPPGSPAPSVTYANTLINEATINKAWPYSDIVASNDFNEVMRRVTSLVTQMEEQGILSYSALTDYDFGALVLGSDDEMYKCLVTNGPGTSVVDPVGNPGTWQSAGVGGVTSILTDGLASGGPITDTGTVSVVIAEKLEAETGTLNTVAMTPLRTRQSIPASPTATTEIRGVVEKSTNLENVDGIADDKYPDVPGVKSMITKHGGSSVWEESGSDIYRATGNVIIGGIAPEAKLDVVGTFKVTDGTEGIDKILTSDIDGLATWETPAAATTVSITDESLDTTTSLIFANDATGDQELHSNANLTFDSATETISSTNLELSGQIKISGGVPGADKVLTSDIDGLATWETPAESGVEVDWIIGTTPADNNWHGITYGNGLFVAVSDTGSGNRVMTSPDGINWTIGTAPVDNNWHGIVYGNGLFVAVSSTGSGNRVMTSPDGITWTIGTSAADNNWDNITYGNGLFVAVSISGTGNRVMTSPDGITWTIGTSAADNNWNGIVYGNGLFVAVSSSGSGNRVMTSPDGITWTIGTSAADNAWYNITYGNGLFVTTSYNGSGNRVMTSPDGITWTIRTSAADNIWSDVTYGNGLFVAVSSSGSGNRVMTSPDGINWTIGTAPVDNGWNEIVYGNGLFVAVASSGTGNRVMTLGVTEETITSTNNIHHGGMTFTGQIKITGGNPGAGKVLTSNANGTASWV